MPTYEYLCDACEHRFELFQSITAKPVRKCPACGMLKVRRLIGAGSGFIFRGSGFYLTDYRSEDYKRKARAEAAGGGSDAASPKKEPSKPSESKGPSPTGKRKKE